uniref:Large ribosomal subunit protein bL21m n=1 Tax=Clastoptera arizonana TaxID=38151 RepID=A0A1B6CM71_9HEMI
MAASCFRLFQNILNRSLSIASSKNISTSSFSKNKNLFVGLNLWHQHSIKSQITSIRTNSISKSHISVQGEVVEVDSKDKQITHETIAHINNQICRGEEGRLFAVIYILGKQYKVTQEDVVVVGGYWAPDIGDQIKFEKVMLLGGSDFTLIGRPILPSNLVSVTATVIDKDLSHVKTRFFKRRRKQFKRINFIRNYQTMIRINEVRVVGEVNKRMDVEGLDQIFH